LQFRDLRPDHIPAALDKLVVFIGGAFVKGIFVEGVRDGAAFVVVTVTGMFVGSYCGNHD
jgi:hypothetical protein